MSNTALQRLEAQYLTSTGWRRSIELNSVVDKDGPVPWVRAKLHIGAVAFIHRFGSSLNEHVHFHFCVVDGVFEEVAGQGSADAPMQASAPSVVFHPATGIHAATVAPVQTTLQQRILRAVVARGLLENCDAKDMLG